MLTQYLASIPTSMTRAKAKAALEKQVRLNGEEFLLRHQVVERRVAAGAKVIDRRGEIVLMTPEGAWLDSRNITKQAINYAAWLSVRE